MSLAGLRRWIMVVCAAASAVVPVYAHDMEAVAAPVHIGVLAFRPKPQTLVQWQPLAQALKRAIPQRNFIVDVYDYAELEAAAASRQVDFILTNPGHYILIAERSGLSAPLATLIGDADGQALSAFGGVIFSRAERADLNSLRDVRGRIVATASRGSLGGYQMQALELKRAGIDLLDSQLLLTGMPHDRVVEAVLAGRADIGLVRTGTLEGMAREGGLALPRLKLLNQQDLPSFPQLLSTRLYPEWPFAALPHIEPELARQVTATLFRLQETDPATLHAMAIDGFTIPADYTPVETLLKELRLPPFESAPSFTAHDVWERYHWLIFVALCGTGLILLLAVRLMAVNRRLVAERLLVQRQTQRLQESDARFRAVVEGTSDAIYLKDPQGRYLMLNSATARFVGKAPLEIIGRDDSFIFPADEARTVMAGDRKVMQGGKVETYEECVTTADGSRRTFFSTKGPIFDSAGRVAGLFGIARDITERKQANDALREKSEALQRSNADLEQFAYSVSHDMRQPLRSVTGHLQLLEKALAGQLDENNRENLSFALDGAKRMDAMIVSLLDYSRVGRKTGAKQWLESRQPLDEALSYLAPVIEEAHAALDIGGAWPRIFASRDELTRLFQNLIGNALKYHATDQPPRVALASQATADLWRVSVTDQGIGIDPQQADRLFQFFSRLQSRANFEGTGMGLALCRRIVEHHAGRIWVESAGAGQGSTFIFELPLSRSGDKEMAA